MKKILVMAALMVATLSANAQVFVGGTLGLSTSEVKVGDNDGVNTTSISLIPEVGYNFSEDWAVGVGLGYLHSKTDNIDALDMFEINPYVRYTFTNIGKNVRMFAEASFEYATGSQGDVDTDAWGIGLRPGILVNVTSNLQFVGRINLISYGSTTDDPKVKTTKFEFDPTNVQLGIQYNF